MTRSSTRRPLPLLYEIVKAVAEEAARRSVPPKEARSVTQGEWIDATPAVEAVEERFGSIPLAHEILRQLQVPNREKITWRQLLDRACRDASEVKKLHEIFASEPDRELDERDYVFALLFIARRTLQATLNPDEYEAAREDILARARTAFERQELAIRLPTHGQITRAADGWDDALSEAGLRSRYSGQPRSRPAGLRASVVKEAANEPLLPGVWSEKYPRAEVIRHVQEFLRTLPQGVSPIDRLWRKFITDAKEETPSIWVIKRHGGLALLIKEASRPDWQERARVWETRAAELRKQRQSELRAKRRATVAPPTEEGIATRTKVLRFLADNGTSGTSAIVDHTGLSRIRVQQLMGEFVRCEYVKRTEEYARSPKQTYQLQQKGRKAMKNERMLVEGYQRHGGRRGRRGRGR
jgi:hypothetical protein